MLKAKNISYQNNGAKIFENINLSISKWVVWIFWASWTWKTTFLKTIGGFNKASSWEILYDWEDIWKNILKYRRKNWFHFQDFNLIELSVQENLQLPFILGKSFKDKLRVDHLLEYFEISHLLKKNINEISGWEKERVSIVKSFASKPKLVFLDEATASLDQRLKIKVFDFIKKYAKENIVFLINHDKNFIDFFKLENSIYEDNFQVLC